MLAADLASCLLMFDAESLVPCLLQQVLPLVTNHVDAETITEDPKGWALARMTAHAVCLGLNVEQTRSKRNSYDEEMERPSKMKKVDSSTSSSRIQQALAQFFEDIIAIIKCTQVGPLPALLVSFLQQAVASTGACVGPLSAYSPEDLVKEILELSPSLLSAPDVLLGLCNMKTSEGRKLCAKALCNNI